MQSWGVNDLQPRKAYLTVASDATYTAALDRSFWAVLVNNQESSGCILCLDAGDILSFASSTSQYWLDRSPSSNNFAVGLSTGSSTDDPTFNGTIGACSSQEYFLFNATNTFTVITQPAAFNSLHQSSATFTLMVVEYFAQNPGAGQNTFGEGNVTGMNFFNDGGGTGPTNQIIVYNSASVVLNHNSGNSLGTGSWVVPGMSIQSTAGSVSFHWKNGAIDGSAFSALYSSPSAGSATNNMAIGPVALNGLSSGARVAAVMLWNRALSTTEMNTIYNAQYGPKARFGL